MAELINTKKKNNTARNDGWVYIILLIASFLWISIYPSVGNTVSSFWTGYGNLLNTSSLIFSNVVLDIFASSIISWIVFEFVFYLYRFWLSGNIYSFIVPLSSLKTESRLFFIYRNVIYGIFVNLCFFVPYLYTYITFINLVVTFSMALLFACHLNKAYAEPIIGHFVFKSFIYPVFVFEIISTIWQVVEVLL